jgi:UDP-N-acetylglucosamine 2-epimerase
MGICFGNSSGGIKEPTFFNCNSLNIGSRQRNRVKPSNVIDIKKINSKFIYKMIQKSLIYKNKKKPNPYSLEISLKSLKAKIIKIIKKKEFNLKKCTY